MDASPQLIALISTLLVLGSAFFVAAEYALVTTRRSRIESLAKRGNKAAKSLIKTLDNTAAQVAGIQMWISLVSIGTGTITEPYVSQALVNSFGRTVPHWISHTISILSVTFVLVVVGELFPKYLSMRLSEKVALITFRPLRPFITLVTPFVWLAQRTAGLMLRPFGINIFEQGEEAVPRDELVMLVESQRQHGVLDELHAEMVTRALKLDVLMARDIMIHRLDIKWLDIEMSRDALKAKLKQIPYTRMPVCRGDIDELVGIVYLHDLVRTMDDPDFNLEKVLREPIAIPENLPMERIVTTMRESKIQMLIVQDEYGGTSGLITLEDVVEEVFGELEDRLESERPPIEVFASGRVSARADVRMDELLSRLDVSLELENSTDTLATVIVDGLGRVPRPGDSVKTPLGTLRVENMARRRVTRVSLQLADEWLQASDS